MDKIRHCRVNVLKCLCLVLSFGLCLNVIPKENNSVFFVFLFFLTGIIMSIWPNLVRPGQNIDKSRDDAGLEL